MKSLLSLPGNNMRFPSCLLDVQLPNRRCFPQQPARDQPCTQRKRLLQTKKKGAENITLSTTKSLNISQQGWLAGFSATNPNQRASQQVLRHCASSLPRRSGIKAPGGAGQEHAPGAASLRQPGKELHALPRAGSQLEKRIFSMSANTINQRVTLRLQRSSERK